jgi:NADH dehydrogenase (ubiquinone) Fe-S protein 5
MSPCTTPPTLFVPLGISSLLTRDNQAARTLALQAAYRKAEANIKRDDAPSAGEIRRLGVLDAPLEEKNLKASKWFSHKEIN